MLGIGVALLILRERWTAQDEEEARTINPDGAKRIVSLRQSFLLPAVMVGMALFFLTTGATSTTINLSKSLLTARAIAGASYWISFYWGFSFVGRVIIGFVAYRLNNVTLLRACMIGMALGAALLWQPASAATQLRRAGAVRFGGSAGLPDADRRVAPPGRSAAPCQRHRLPDRRVGARAGAGARRSRVAGGTHQLGHHRRDPGIRDGDRGGAV